MGAKRKMKGAALKAGKYGLQQLGIEKREGEKRGGQGINIIKPKAWYRLLPVRGLGRSH